MRRRRRARAARAAALALTPPPHHHPQAGDDFGPSGSLQKGDFLAPVPPPPPMPWDTPVALMPANLATRTGGNGVCIARSLYTGDGFAYRFCPFQRVDHFEGAGAIGNLGFYTGVIRDNNNANCPGANAITGMTFADGSICNGVPSTSTVEFECIDILGAGLVDWGTRTPMIRAAIRSADGCSATLSLPLPGACNGARFAHCGSAAASPNPSPAPSPVFTFSDATIVSWAPGLVTALAPGTVPPPAVRVRRADTLALSTAYEPEGPGALPASASPIPVPFPQDLQIIAISPQQGVRGQCNPVTIQLAGVNAGDVTGSGFTHLIRVRVPTSANGAQNYNALGLPGPVDGATPVPPANGLLNVTIPCLNTMSSWPTFPTTVDLTVGSFWSQASLGTHLIRNAVCQTPGCLRWTFLAAPGDAAAA